MKKTQPGIHPIYSVPHFNIRPLLTSLDCPKVLRHTHTLSGGSSTEVENIVIKI